jgi:DNA-binding MurR/RpiR family transcriptional regulator
VAEPCTANPPAARKIASAILQALSSAGQTHVADAIGVSEATVSRLQSQHVESFSALLACLQLKVVPAAHKCYSPEHIAHLEYFARLGMQQQSTPLQWEGDDQ